MNLAAAARTIAVLVAALLCGAGPAYAADADYVIVFREGVEPDAATSALEKRQSFRASHRYGASLRGFSARLSDGQRRFVEADPSVEYVTRDIPFQATAMTPVAARENIPVGIRRTRAATATQVHRASDDGVAVIDTGLDLSSTDLNAVSGVNCVSSGTPAQDDNGHGTHIGGTLAGRNSGTGVVGVAPGTRLHAVKVLNAKAGGTLSGLLCGIEWVTRNAASLRIRVVNMSISGPGANDGDCGRSNNDPLHTAICASVAAGVNYVVSAGNARTDIANLAPASYPEVLTATATTDTDGLPGGKGSATCGRTEIDDTPWTSSNYAVAPGDSAHVIAAPGACIVSTKRGGGTTTMSGTSMAAPHVAGAVALCLSSGGVPGPCAPLTPSQTQARVLQDARAAADAGWGFLGDPLRPITGKVFGPLVSAVTY